MAMIGPVGNNSPVGGVTGESERDESAPTTGSGSPEHDELTFSRDSADALTNSAPESLAGGDSPPRLGKRLANRRTLLSFGVAIILLVLAMRGLKVDPHEVWRVLRRADLTYFALAFGIYYVSFPARGQRWRLLMANASEGEERQRIMRYSLFGLTEILFLSWFANCLVPARLGDIYRAYLARTCVGVSMSKTVGTVLGERMLDLLVLCPLLLFSTVWAFRGWLGTVPQSLQLAPLGGLVLAILTLVVLVVLWRFHEVINSLLPRRAAHVFMQLRHGALHSLRDNLLSLVGLTALIWLMEGWRLYFVLASLHLLRAGEIGFAVALFLALGAAVLTILFLTPGGVGGVELFLTGTLATVFLHNAPGAANLAASAAVLDRLLTYVSLVLIGFVLYLFSNKTRTITATPAVSASGHSA